LALGPYFGKNLENAIKEFQKRTGLKADGNIGPLTLAKLKEFGFKY
jgi:murein L,D-transpeptidase YcbB/YkuD